MLSGLIFFMCYSLFYWPNNDDNDDDDDMLILGSRGSRKKHLGGLAP